MSHYKAVPPTRMEYDGRSGVYRQEPSGRWRFKEYTSAEQRQIEEACNRFLLARHQQMDFGVYWHICAHGFIGFDYIPQIPKPTTFLVEEKNGSSNGKLWRLAKSDPSLIVVSDYAVKRGKVTCRPVFKDVGSASYVNYVYITQDVLVKYGFLTAHPEIPGADLFGGSARFYCRANVVSFNDYTFQKEDPAVVYKSVSQQLEEHLVIDDMLVTSTIKKADTACMDVLTAAAEMPQTLRSVIQGMAKVAGMVRSAKKGEFALSEAFLKKKKRDELKHNAKLHELQKQLALSVNNRQRKSLQRLIQREQKAFSKAMLKTAKELADAVANVWLNFRYNIMPIVYTIQDAENLYDSWTATYKTSRDKESGEIELVLNEFPVQLKVQHKCFIKRLLNPELKFSSLTSANLISTGYQLIPYTFILDWFVNAGDVIVAMSSPSYALKEGATYSVKCPVRFQIAEQGIEVDYELYRRTAIQPSNHISLGFKFDMNFFRYLDSLALLWRPIREALIRSKRN